MIARLRRAGLWSAGFATSVAAIDSARACQVCFGNPESPMVQGALWGVWALLGVVLAVQLAFALFFFVYLRRRAKLYRQGRPGPCSAW